jgi:hypothetical protein
VVLAAVVLADVASAAAGIWPVGDPAPVQGRRLLRGLSLLAQLRLPIPLGGTSNYFRSRMLQEVGGWDAWNITEDADIGTRLARF